MKAVAICGYKGSGKDFVANVLINWARQHNFYGRKAAFADPIKWVIMDAFDLNEELEYDNFKRSSVQLSSGKVIPGRDILRSIGMTMRSFNQDEFVKRMDKYIKTINPPHELEPIVVITDLRFKNEVKWAKENHIPIIKVKRNTAVFDGHVSEMEIDDFLCDYIVDNNRDPEQTEDHVKKIASIIFS
jgi:hypothetical protein